MLLTEIEIIEKCPSCLSSIVLARGTFFKCNFCDYQTEECEEQQIPHTLHWYAKEIDSVFSKIFNTK